ncbi:hypothetical protein CYQ88_03335 [Hydrogenovibrio sp. SC-1]|uniref:hypothetical protein n=1 Tax=Hydrogenovibrio sp. SC-1 TaxID=2065820 RepID=UPI000C7D9F4B|nr:hypothetical protein [Hydrogenovibrio sp. SC-1]PLA74946.1 hypothetical protein CYQ88_03335 [Hydrogenovibrio sp. SC-1]
MMIDTVFNNTFFGGHGVWMLVVFAVIIIPFWRICQRIGYPGWVSVLIWIPLVNIIFIYFIAFSDWTTNKAGEHHD